MVWDVVINIKKDGILSDKIREIIGKGEIFPCEPTTQVFIIGIILSLIILIVVSLLLYIVHRN